MALLASGGSGRDIAIDLGTANTLVYERGRGIALSEPSVVAIDSDSGEVLAVGDEARRMIGRTPANISAIRPLRHGVIADFEVTERMLRHFIRGVQSRRLTRSRVVMCAPSGVTDVEKRAVEEACLSAGARQVHLIEEPMAAAIGANLPIAEATGSMVVDVGGGTSEVAVIALGGIVVSQSLRIGGYDFDDAIAGHMKRAHTMAIGEQAAEGLKLEIGSATELEPELEADVRGRDLVTGLPKQVRLSSSELRQACAEPLRAIVEAVKETLERTPPELAADLSERGIVMAGGGALLRGFDALLRAETQLPVQLAESPLTCVAVGAGHALEEFDALDRVGNGARHLRLRRRRTSFSRRG
ncbi:MAG: rod shape-determining protein MreB [Thermoleophilaceae bacterium]|jgi:rod shape-determining protein MreB|nr:rod shape-determining protein MreB [Thermoleophilaceae bacterium]